MDNTLTHLHTRAPATHAPMRPLPVCVVRYEEIDVERDRAAVMATAAISPQRAATTATEIDLERQEAKLRLASMLFEYRNAPGVSGDGGPSSTPMRDRCVRACVTARVGV